MTFSDSCHKLFLTLMLSYQQDTMTTIKYLLFIVAITVPLFTCAKELKGRKRQHKCEPITISMCRSMPYNMTRMPERMSQNNVRPLLERFQPLLSTRCSKYLRFFMCSRFVPICTLDFVVRLSTRM